MAFDITKKRAAEKACIDLVQGDGSPLLGDDGAVLGIVGFGPGSKRWQQADAERSRKRTQRIEKNRGKISAALEGGAEDEIDFLVAVTDSFVGWEYPNPDAEDGRWPTASEMYRAAYKDDGIGFIRDHFHKEVNDWGPFTRGSKS